MWNEYTHDNIYMHTNIYMKNNINHLYMCIHMHLKMMPGKYLGKADIPVYGNVENKLNSGVYYKWHILYILSYKGNKNWGLEVLD